MNKKYWLKCPALSVELKKRKSKKFYFTWVLGFPKKSANLVLPFGQLYINIYVDIFINTLAGLPDVAQVYIIIHN